jgi:hypothetical protein
VKCLPRPVNLRAHLSSENYSNWVFNNNVLRFTYQLCCSYRNTAAGNRTIYPINYWNPDHDLPCSYQTS